MNSGIWVGRALRRKGRWCREPGDFQIGGNSVSKDLEAKVSVLENSK